MFIVISKNTIQTSSQKIKYSVFSEYLSNNTKKGTNMIYGYIRVSTDKQDCENQKTGIVTKALSMGLNIDKYIMDSGISGTVEPNNRALGGILKKLKSGDIIICSEISRLGRKLFMIMRILEHCMKIGAKVLTVKDGYELGDNVQSKILAFAFGLVAELEREMISKRTKEALQHLKAEGRAIGRPKGRKNTKHIWNGKERKINRLLKQGVEKTKIARLTGMGVSSLYTFLKQRQNK